jgi:FkbM family methyltransferase
VEKKHEISLLGKEFAVRCGAYDRFWSSVNNGRWEKNTYIVFERYIDENALYVDFGAWIGSTVLFAGQLAKSSIAFEPDPRAYEELEINLQKNTQSAWASNIRIFNKAIHASGKPILLFVKADEGGDSTSSTITKRRENSIEIKTYRLEDAIKEFREGAEKVFVKMDIEGGEYELLPSISSLLASEENTFFIEFHHRIFRQSFNDGIQGWESRYEQAWQPAYAALPSNRKYRTDTGEELGMREVEKLLRGRLTMNGQQVRNLIICSE